MSKSRPARTREEWLREAIRRFRPTFAEIGRPLPAKIRITVGFGPNGARQENSKVMGVTCAKAMSADGVNEIFISPEDADVVSMLETVHHELIHVYDDCASGHRGEFKEMAALLGLTGKLTHSEAGPELAAKLAAMAEEMGPYPGAAMILVDGKPAVNGDGPVTSGPKPQTARMLKRSCQMDPEADCWGYTVRLAQKWIEVGNPICPEGHEMMA